MSATIDQARAAKRALAERLDGDPAVVGVGIARRGEGWAVKVDLARERELPDEHDGVAVVSELVGRIRLTGS